MVCSKVDDELEVVNASVEELEVVCASVELLDKLDELKLLLDEELEVVNAAVELLDDDSTVTASSGFAIQTDCPRRHVRKLSIRN